MADDKPLFNNTWFSTGKKIMKIGGGYSGPGVSRGVIMLPNGELRVVVGHKIEGGEGELLHIYSVNQLTPYSGE